MSGIIEGKIVYWDRINTRHMRQRPLTNRLRSLGIVIVALFVTGIAGGEIPAFAQSPAVLATLPNGLRIVTAPSHAVGLVAIDAWMRAGATRQPIGHFGVAHYLEHVLFKGTPTRPNEEQIDGAIENLGGSFNAATSFDWAHFYVVVPSENFAAALAVIGDVLQHASITDKSVQSERPIILSEVARGIDNPDEVMNAQIRAMVYGPKHPYGVPVTGVPQDVQTITRDQVAAFYKTFYAPNNMTLVVTGDIAPEQVQKEAQSVFGGWAKSMTLDPPDPPALPQLTSIHRTILRRSASSSSMMIAFGAPSVADKPDAWVMDVLLTLLGQGANNRLTRTLRDQQKIVDSISADYLTQQHEGILTVTASFPTGNPDAVEKAIVDQIQNLRDEVVSAWELDAAKQSLMASYLFDVQTDSGRADALGFYDMIDTYQYDVDYIAHFETVTGEDLRRAAVKYLTPDKYNIVTIIPFTDPSSAQAPSATAASKTASY
ncbi:MAG: pitrilysin family protein [Capsulimonadaceae bacterium]|nr:pitrilysin family protein [Capsulimonadaceae bacterium]